MRKFSSLLLPIPILFAAHSLFSQIPCDSAKISAAIARSSELLEGGKIQDALELALHSQNGLAACPADSVLLEEVFLLLDDCYQEATVDFLNKSMFNKAIDMAERCLALNRHAPSGHPDHLAKAYFTLANAHNLNGNPKIAIESAAKGLNVRKSTSPSDPKIALNYDQLVTFSIALNDTATARLWLQEWNHFHRNIGSKAGEQARINLARYWSM